MLQFEIGVVLLLVLLNGFLAMCEFAVVSSRRSRLEQEADAGNARARAVLDLLDSPSTFLATVQVGITVVGIVAGVFGGATLAEKLASVLGQFEIFTAYERPLAFGIVVAVITFLSLLVGELIPKRIALAYPETIAKSTVPLLSGFALVVRPFVWILETATEVVLAPFSLAPSVSAEVSQEDIKSIVAQGSKAGVIEEGERRIISRVFRLGNRPVSTVMTPRTDIEYLEGVAPIRDSIARAIESKRSWLPVVGESTDEVLGIVAVRSLLEVASGDGSGPTSEVLRSHLIAPVKVPETTPALRLLEMLRSERLHFAIVVDEYGGLAGIATLHDLVEALVGEIGDPEEDTAMITRRNDGSYLVDAGVDIQDLWDDLGIPDKSPFDDSDFHSLGGFVMSRLGHVPHEGEMFEAFGYSFEVIDMDRHRIDKVLVSKLAEDTAAQSA